MFGAFTLGNATGRYLIAVGFDAWRSYKTPLGIVMVALVLAVLVCFALGSYPREQKTALAPTMKV